MTHDRTTAPSPSRTTGPSPVVLRVQGYRVYNDCMNAKLARLIGYTVVFHFLWENLQGPLYGGYQSPAQWASIALYGTAGAVMYTLLVYWLYHWWTGNRSLVARDFMLLAGIGFVLAIGIELKAMYFELWSYAPTMPLIPLLNVGLSPILQMTLLLPPTVWLANTNRAEVGSTAKH